MEIPESLIELQRAADAGSSADWTAWREAAEQVQAAITHHAEAAGENRAAVEAAVKKAARHPE